MGHPQGLPGKGTGLLSCDRHIRIVDVMFGREDTRLKGRMMTMCNLAFELQTARVTYSRSDYSLILQGPDEITETFFIH